MSLAWLDGQPAEALPITDRGLAYGDGLFETLRVSRGKPLRLERHWARLVLGCQRLSIPLDQNTCRRELLEFSERLGEGVCKLMLTRGVGLRGYASPDPCLPSRVLLGNPMPAYPAARQTDGIALFPCATALAEQPLLAGIKHLNRLEQVLARAEWQDPSYAEGLMRDTSGRVIEGVFSNIFLVKEGCLLTPLLSRCGVAGVMRAEVLDWARAQDLEFSIQDISYEHLMQADEVFTCNSLYGIWPVRQLADRFWPVGSVTRQIQLGIQAQEAIENA